MERRLLPWLVRQQDNCSQGTRCGIDDLCFSGDELARRPSTITLQLHTPRLGFLNVEHLGSYASSMEPQHPVQIDWSRLRRLSLNSCVGASSLLWRLASINVNLTEFVLRNEYSRQEQTPSFDAALQYFLDTQPGLELLSIMVSSTNSSSIFRTINLLHLENQPADKTLKVLVLDGRHEAREGASRDPVPQSKAQLSQIVKHYPNLLELACNIPFPVSRPCPKNPPSQHDLTNAQHATTNPSAFRPLSPLTHLRTLHLRSSPFKFRLRSAPGDVSPAAYTRAKRPSSSHPAPQPPRPHACVQAFFPKPTTTTAPPPPPSPPPPPPPRPPPRPRSASPQNRTSTSFASAPGRCLTSTPWPAAAISHGPSWQV